MQLNYGFDSAPLAALVGLVFDRIARQHGRCVCQTGRAGLWLTGIVLRPVCRSPLSHRWRGAYGGNASLPCRRVQPWRIALAASSQQGLALWPGKACGVWGRVVGLDWVLRAGDRVEMYRPLTVDPKTARRQRFARQGVRATGLFSRQRPGGKQATDGGRPRFQRLQSASRCLNAFDLGIASGLIKEDALTLRIGLFHGCQIPGKALACCTLAVVCTGGSLFGLLGFPFWQLLRLRPGPFLL